MIHNKQQFIYSYNGLKEFNVDNKHAGTVGGQKS